MKALTAVAAALFISGSLAMAQEVVERSAAGIAIVGGG